MDSQQYISILRRRLWLVVLITVASALSAAFFSSRQPKVYEATATLLINPAAPSQAIPYLQASLGAGSQGTLAQLASTYDVYLTSLSFDERVAAKMGVPLTQVSGHLSSALVGTTNFYQISATGNTPQIAQQLANVAASQFIEQNLSVLQSRNPTRTVGPSQAVLDQVVKEITQVSALDQKLTGVPDPTSTANQTLLATVEQRLANLTSSYNQLLSQGGATAGQALNTATLTSPALLPTSAISPKVRNDILLGVGTGLLLGFLLVFVIEYLEYTIRTPEDLEVATGQLPLAVIALSDTRQRRHGGQPAAGSSAGLFTLNEPRSGVSEAFRTLRTNLAFSVATRQDLRTLVVASVLPGEGKSTVAANLAVVMAQSGKRVILVDADLRRPSLHTVFGLPRSHGLTDVLVGAVDLPPALKATTVPNLRLLLCGTIPPNPAELLASDAMKPLIAALKHHADLVIFDTPPMGALTDAVVLSTQVDGTLLVVRAGSTRPNVVKRGLETLARVGAHPLGLVLNCVLISTLRDYSSYYYYYAYAQADEYSEANAGNELALHDRSDARAAHP